MGQGSEAAWLRAWDFIRRWFPDPATVPIGFIDALRAYGAGENEDCLRQLKVMGMYANDIYCALAPALRRPLKDHESALDMALSLTKDLGQLLGALASIRDKTILWRRDEAIKEALLREIHEIALGALDSKNGALPGEE